VCSFNQWISFHQLNKSKKHPTQWVLHLLQTPTNFCDFSFFLLKELPQGCLVSVAGCQKKKNFTIAFLKNTFLIISCGA